MPVTVVVGAQYGSEGKGKVVGYLAGLHDEPIVVRVGGPNSGHTVVDNQGYRHVVRQLPVTAALNGTSPLIIPPGAYVSLDVLMREIAEYDVSPTRLRIDRRAYIIGSRHIAHETDAQLSARIGSTQSGTGAAVAERVLRKVDHELAGNIQELGPYLADTNEILGDAIDAHRRVIVEGTQGFGLSLLHGTFYPYSTSRDTSAAGALSEAGLSPVSVDEVVLVCRANAIRVGGESGPLHGETTWEHIAENANIPDLREYTTVTGRERRVGDFNSREVRRALNVNRPTMLVLNHADYLSDIRNADGRRRVAESVRAMEEEIGHKFDLIGMGPRDLQARDKVIGRVLAA